jgi:hypothetical protein
VTSISDDEIRTRYLAEVWKNAAAKREAPAITKIRCRWDVDVESTPSPSESLPLIVGPAPWRASPASSRPGSQPSSALITPRWCDSWPPTPRRGWLSSTHSRLGSEPGGSMTPPPRSLAASGLVTPRQRAGRPSSPPPGSPPRIDDGDLRLPRVAPASAPSPPA